MSLCPCTHRDWRLLHGSADLLLELLMCFGGVALEGGLKGGVGFFVLDTS